jgi:hypothetical protein
MKAMARQRSHSIAFKRQVAQEFIAGETLYGLFKRHDISRQLIRSIGNTTVKPDELARSVLRLATEGERDPVRLHDKALEGLIPATAWREAS